MYSDVKGNHVSACVSILTAHNPESPVMVTVSKSEGHICRPLIGFTVYGIVRTLWGNWGVVLIGFWSQSCPNILMLIGSR